MDSFHTTTEATLRNSLLLSEGPKRAISKEMGSQIFKHYWEWLEIQEKECFRILEAQFCEKEWQIYLYQGRFGFRWITQDGEVVEILHFGRWNHEEGPDFIGALVRFGREAPVRGDLELDRDVRDWERHRHAQNSVYRNVLVHFFFEKPPESLAFTRNVEGRCVRQVLLDPEQIQPSKLFWQSTPPCLFSTIAISDILKLIEAAARFRMLRKQEAFQRQVVFYGFADALFQAIAIVLGYRPNSLPFNLLARRIGNTIAASPSGEALLFGLAGFLRGEEFMHVSPDARKYLRSLWDIWWSYRDYFSIQQLPSQLWKRTSVRPFNSPERRLGALAVIANQWSLVQELVHAGKEAAFVDLLKSLSHPFWQAHCSFWSEPHQQSLLLGEERLMDLLVNAFYPAAAQGIEDPAVWSRFQCIRLRQIPKKIWEAYSIFVGEGRLPPARLREPVIQQGLLQMIAHFDRFDFSSPAGGSILIKLKKCL